MTGPPTSSVPVRTQLPCREFLCAALRGGGAAILYLSPAGEAPIRAVYETPEGERVGIAAYLSRLAPYRREPDRLESFTLFRRAQVELWHDPAGLWITVLCGVDPRRGLFVAADPWLHATGRPGARIALPSSRLARAARAGWHAWEHEPLAGDRDAPVEVLVAGRIEHFLDLVRFERDAWREETGHRHLLADRVGNGLSLEAEATR